jgi:hypothetical protein
MAQLLIAARVGERDGWFILSDRFDFLMWLISSGELV